jgi:peptidoglycan hydrolase-like protein with peptidoglycan-binding domain
MKNHLGKYAAAIATVMVLAAPFAAGALSVEDLQGQIRALMAQVAALQQRIQMIQASSTTPANFGNSSSDPLRHRICLVLLRNLAQGAQGDDVASLQDFLKSQGFFLGNSTGYYGSLTLGAVAKWQAANGIDPAGVFGPLSQSKLKIWCDGFGGSWQNKEKFTATPMRGDAPLTVTFNTWISGFRLNTIKYVIDYGDGTSADAANCPAPADACTGPGINTHTYAQNGSYTAVLKKTTSYDCAAHEGTWCVGLTAREEIMGKQVITVGPITCTADYSPVCGAKQVTCIQAPCNPIPTTYSNRCAMNADDATYLYAGACRTASANPAEDTQCKSWFDGCNTCSRQSPGGIAACTLMYCANPANAYCKAYFDGTTTGNQSPTISGFSGPTVLATGANGTWTVEASDPEGGQLSYRVLWGDEKTFTSSFGSILNNSYDFTQSTTFTHAYINAGTYTVAITVRDSAGQEAKTTTTVKVGSDSVVCTEEYAPVCGQPKWSCPAGMFCATVMPAPQAYSNLCKMNAAGATFIKNGQCTSESSTGTGW